MDQVAFWDAGSPGYRWFELLNKRVLSGANITPYPHRLYAYVATAMYDATIAAWDSKYAYNRLRPTAVDTTQAAESRIWGGIHYRVDLNAGVTVGRSVAQKFIAWASADGSQ